MLAQARSSTKYRSVMDSLCCFVHEVVARGIINHAVKRSGVTLEELEQNGMPSQFMIELEKGIDLFIDNPAHKLECKNKLALMNGGKHNETPAAAPAKSGSTARRVQVAVSSEQEIVTARNRARQMAETVGFSKTDQIKIATAVSELARNIVRYVGEGKVSIELLELPRPGIKIVAEDKGTGIPNLDEIYAGEYKSKTGLGLGIQACKRLMDEFDLKTSPVRGTTVIIQKYRQ